MKKVGKDGADKTTGNQEKNGQMAIGLSRKEVERQLRSGNLTEKQATELRQRYMDSLEYNEEQQFVTCCGGIRPLPVLLPLDEEDEECTEQS